MLNAQLNTTSNKFMQSFITYLYVITDVDFFKVTCFGLNLTVFGPLAILKNYCYVKKTCIKIM